MKWPTFHFRAMGSEIGVWLDADPTVAQRAFVQVQTHFEKTEQTLSRFRPDSELSRLNKRPEHWTVVSRLMWSIISAALALAEATGGLFDPTMLPALEAAGYTDTFDKVRAGAAAPPAKSAAIAANRWQEVALDPKRRAVRLPVGVQLDLGGIAKGIVAQQAIDLLDQVGPALVDAGGDLTATRRPRGWPGWPVSVAAPDDGNNPGKNILRLWLTKATLATSGTDYRQWQQGGQSVHHLIDPRTGRPAISDVVTATVLATDAATAEGWATAALIAGSNEAFNLMLKRDLAAALVCRNGRILLTPSMEAIQ